MIRRRRSPETTEPTSSSSSSSSSTPDSSSRIIQRESIKENERRLKKEDDVVVNDDKNERKGKDTPKIRLVSSSLSLSSSNPTISYAVAKWVILRLLGIVYLVAFLGAWYQNKGLMGTHGLQPAITYMKRLQDKHDSPWQGFLNHPTLFWWIPLSDDAMDMFAILGCILSSAVIAGLNSWIVMFMLWLLDFSVVTIAEGTSFYSYGWESQLLETGFLAIFLCDLPHWRPGSSSSSSSLFCDRPTGSAPSPIILWLFCWLSFRISIGAGLIKTRGSSCWADKTCLYYHFETQPIPSPLSFIFHFLPKWMLSRAVDLDLLVQLYTSWFVLMPSTIPYLPNIWTRLSRTILRIGGFLQTGFMLNIILSGNFAFLNHLTIIPSLACLDDACWPTALFYTRKQQQQHHQQEKQPDRIFPISPRRILDIALALWIGHLSTPVVMNLLQWGGSRQQMNASFDPFRLVNTYGAFGSVGEARYEPIIAVQFQNETKWIELELPCKPGKLDRRPCFCAPYHYRMDWNIWFIGFKPHQMYLQRRETWMYVLLEKILQPNLTERPWLDLLDISSRNLLEQHYNQGEAPTSVKVDMYNYRMKEPLWTVLSKSLTRKRVVWWNRTYEESLIPPLTYDTTRRRLVLVR